MLQRIVARVALVAASFYLMCSVGMAKASVIPSAFAGAIEHVNSLLAVSQHFEDTDDFEIYEEDYDYSNMSKREILINSQIDEIKKSDLTLEERVCAIGMCLYENSDITYELSSNLFGANGDLLDERFFDPGVYYFDGMTFDCSSFVQYVVWLATVEEGYDLRRDHLLIGRATYFQSIEGTSISEPCPGCLCFFYNGGAGVKRTGEIMGKNEVSTKETNHVALYLGEGLYLDCSNSAGRLRLTSVEEKPYFAELFTHFRQLPQEDYISHLEYEFNSGKKWSD